MDPFDEEKQKFQTAINSSRAVKIKHTPSPPFIHALAFGSVSTKTKTFEEHMIRDAVVKGFLKPKKSLESNLVDYTGYDLHEYVIGNHLQADYYRDWLSKVKFSPCPFVNAADVILDVLPQIRLHQLLGPCDNKKASPFSSRLSAVPVPHEDNWNNCILKLFGRGATTYYSSKKGIGKPDFYCKLASYHLEIIIESLMTTNNVQEHADRFLDVKFGGKDLYNPNPELKLKGFRALRGLLVIGCSLKAIQHKVSAVELQSGNVDVLVMGISPQNGYKMMDFIWRKPNGTSVHTIIPCDSVPRRLRDEVITIGRTPGNKASVPTLLFSPPTLTPIASYLSVTCGCASEEEACQTRSQELNFDCSHPERNSWQLP